MKKIIICGHFADGLEKFDGQTIKTRMIYDQLTAKYGKGQIEIIDTYNWRKHPFKLCRSCAKAAKKASDIIILPADKGTKVFVPLFVKLKKKNAFKLHHVLIGSELYKITEKSCYVRNKMKEIDYIYAENHGLIEKLKMQGIDRLYYMPNFKKLSRTSKKTKNSGCDNKILHCCIFSRIEKEKGIIDAINVVNKYNNCHSDKKIHLDIYGKVKECFEKEFRGLLLGNKYIKYIGVIKPEKSVENIDKYDLLLFPTKYWTEGIPGTIIDAYYAGVPVLASRWENYDEIVKESKTGFGYKFNDVNDFYNLLAKVMENVAILRTMKGNCLQEALNYSPENAMGVLTKNLNVDDGAKTILCYIDSMHRGGAERVMSILTNEFSRDGHKVILATDVPVLKNKDNYVISDKVECVYINPKSNNFFRKNWQRMKQLRKIVRNEKVDTTLSFLGEQNYRMLIATIGLKCRKCVSVRNDPTHEYGKTRLKKWVANRIIDMADACVFQTEEAKKYFNERVQKKSEVIANPIDDKFFKIKRAKSPKNIITVGRLEPQKNQKLLIDAFASIADKIDDDLLIYGEGSLAKELREYIKSIGMTKRIFLKGGTDNIGRELAKGKLFVLSSEYEGMPNALMEAMAAGVPCVATDCPCGGVRALAGNNAGGALVTCGDVDEMGKTVLRIIKSKSLSAMGKRAKTRMTEHKTDSVVLRWKTLLLLSDNAGGR